MFDILGDTINQLFDIDIGICSTEKGLALRSELESISEDQFSKRATLVAYQEQLVYAPSMANHLVQDDDYHHQDSYQYKRRTANTSITNSSRITEVTYHRQSIGGKSEDLHSISTETYTRSRNKKHMNRIMESGETEDASSDLFPMASVISHASNALKEAELEYLKRKKEYDQLRTVEEERDYLGNILLQKDSVNSLESTKSRSDKPFRRKYRLTQDQISLDRIHSPIIHDDDDDNDSSGGYSIEALVPQSMIQNNVGTNMMRPLKHKPEDEQGLQDHRVFSSPRDHILAPQDRIPRGQKRTMPPPQCPEWHHDSVLPHTRSGQRDTPSHPVSGHKRGGKHYDTKGMTSVSTQNSSSRCSSEPLGSSRRQEEESHVGMKKTNSPTMDQSESYREKVTHDKKHQTINVRTAPSDRSPSVPRPDRTVRPDTFSDSEITPKSPKSKRIHHRPAYIPPSGSSFIAADQIHHTYQFNPKPQGVFDAKFNRQSLLPHTDVDNFRTIPLPDNSLQRLEEHYSLIPTSSSEHLSESSLYDEEELRGVSVQINPGGIAASKITAYNYQRHGIDNSYIKPSTTYTRPLQNDEDQVAFSDLSLELQELIRKRAGILLRQLSPEQIGYVSEMYNIVMRLEPSIRQTAAVEVFEVTDFPRITELKKAKERMYNMSPNELLHCAQFKPYCDIFPLYIAF